MAAYFIVDVDIHDQKGIEAYRQGVPATLAKYGGRFLVRGGSWTRLEGEWEPKRLVILEFPSVEQARRWYDSEAANESWYRGAPRLCRGASERLGGVGGHVGAPHSEDYRELKALRARTAKTQLVLVEGVAGA